MAKIKKTINKKKLTRAIIAGVLLAGVITGIYYYAINYLLADYANMSYITFRYNLNLTEGEKEPEVTITRVSTTSNYPADFRIPNKLLGYKVTAIGDQAFSLCERLTRVTMPDTVTSIGAGAFLNCSKLKSIDFSSNVQYIGTDALTGTAYLNNQPDGLLYIGDVLYTYKGILPSGTKIKPGSGTEANTVYLDENVTYIGSGLFKNQTGIVSAEFPSQLNGIGDYVFQGCTGLSSVALHDGTETIGAYAFDGCTSLSSIDMPDALNTIGEYAFRNSGLSGTVSIPSNVTIIPIGSFLGSTHITEVVLPANLTTINDSAFSGCTSLADIIFPDQVNWLGTSAFEHSGLVTITLPKSANFTVIGESLFSGCVSLTTVNAYSNVAAIRANAFLGTSSLKSMIILDDDGLSTTPANVVTLPSRVSSIGDYAFKNSGLSSVVIPPLVATLNQGLFQYDVNLANVTISDPAIGGLTAIKPGVFQGCTNLSALVLPESVTTIGDSFLADSGIVSFKFPDGVSTINEYALSNCHELISVTLPTSLYTIKSYAFQNDAGLTALVIPLKTSYIYNYAFVGATNVSFYAEAASQPSNWKELWNSENRPVVWGYVA